MTPDAMAPGPTGSVAHGRITLRGRSAPSSPPPPPVATGSVGHGRIVLRGGSDAHAPASREPIGHGAVKLVARPAFDLAVLSADATAAAYDHILAVLDEAPE